VKATLERGEAEFLSST